MRIRVEAGIGADLPLQMLRCRGQDQLACRPHRPLHQMATTDAVVAPTNVDNDGCLCAVRRPGRGHLWSPPVKLVLVPGKRLRLSQSFSPIPSQAAPGAASKHAAISQGPCAVRVADRRGNPDRVTMSILIEESDFRIDRHQVRR